MLRIYHHSSCVRLLCVHAVAVVSHHERKVEANGWAYPFALSSFVWCMCVYGCVRVWVGAYGLLCNHRHRTVHTQTTAVYVPSIGSYRTYYIHHYTNKWVLCNSRPYFIFRCLVLFGDYVLSHSHCSDDLCTVRVIGPPRFGHFAITLFLLYELVSVLSYFFFLLIHCCWFSLSFAHSFLCHLYFHPFLFQWPNGTPKASGELIVSNSNRYRHRCRCIVNYETIRCCRRR